MQAFEENRAFTCQLAIKNSMKNCGSSQLCPVVLLESSVWLFPSLNPVSKAAPERGGDCAVCLDEGIEFFAD